MSDQRMGEVFAGDEMKHWRNCSTCGERNRRIDEAEGLASDSVLLESEERHEFHLHGDWSAYCICGWSHWADELGYDWTEKVRVTLAKRYREHLD